MYLKAFDYFPRLSVSNFDIYDINFDLPAPNAQRAVN